MSAYCFYRAILAWDSVLLEGQIIPTLEMTLVYLLQRLYQEVLQQRMADSGKEMKHQYYMSNCQIKKCVLSLENNTSTKFLYLKKISVKGRFPYNSVDCLLLNLN